MRPAFFIAEWWQWYWPEVRGNVLAIAPCGIAAYLWMRGKHTALTEAHASLKRAHLHAAAKLDALLDAINPETDGGLADALSAIRDGLDPDTPGGLGAIRERLDHLAPASTVERTTEPHDGRTD